MPNQTLTSRIAALYELQAVFVEPTLKSHGLGWGAFQLLATVHAGGGRVPQAEIARRLGVAPATLCESVQTYVKKGLLVQTASTEDRRAKGLSLTPRAETIVRAVLVALDEAEQAMLHGIGATPRNATAATLDRCLENLERAIGRR